MTRAVGIDLGTTYTVVAVMEEGQPMVIPNAEGQRLTPSVVAFTEEGRPLVGQIAKIQAAANPDRTAFSIKRRMGSSHKMEIDGREYTPQEISSLILHKVKADTEDYLGEKVEKAVITVPAYFNDRQRQATKEAGIMAGLDVIRIINEPTAAALAYGLSREHIHTALVWDLGGGTFDVSLLELDDSIFEVRAVSGDNWLGGDDYDQVVMNYLMEQYRLTTGAPFPENGMARQRLKEAAEKAKIEVSARTSTTVYLPFVGGDSDAPTYLRTTLTRETFQVLSRGLLHRMVTPTYQALADAGLKPEDIDRVILVGGATRMPAVPALARRIFGKEPCQDLDPDEVVALGAAHQAGALLGMGQKAMLLDVLPLSLGIETQGGLFGKLIPRNTPLPASEARLFTTAADGQTSVDIHVLQGERAMAADNLSLGSFQLLGIPSQARGMAKVEVAFDVDVDGMVHVSATDLHTDNTIGVRLVSSQGLRPEEIQRLVDEARARDAEDGRKREEVEAGIMADSGVKAAELFVKEFDGALGEDAMGEVCQAVFKVKEALARGKSLEAKDFCQDLRELLASLHRENRQLSPSEA